MTKIIALFGGSGIGKSTMASEIFSKLKKQDKSVEFVPEFAKELTWQKNFNDLQNQLYVTGVQSQRVLSLINKVDYIVTDSHPYQGLLYCPKSYKKQLLDILYIMFKDIPLEAYLIKRTIRFDPIGRNQTEEESIQNDQRLKTMLDSMDIKYTELTLQELEEKF